MTEQVLGLLAAINNVCVPWWPSVVGHYSTHWGSEVQILPGPIDLKVSSISFGGNGKQRIDRTLRGYGKR